MKNTRQNTFMFYLDQFDRFEYLTMEERGQMITAICKYAKSGEETAFSDRALKVIFDCFKKEMDLDAEKYEQKCEMNRAKGKRGGRPKKDPKDQEKATGFFEEDEKAEKATGFFEEDKKAKKATGFFEEEEKAEKATGFFEEDEKAEKPQIPNTNNQIPNTKNRIPNTNDQTQAAENAAAEIRHQAPPVSLYGIYHNVPFSEVEMEQLRHEFPQDWNIWIERVSYWYHNKGRDCVSGLADIRRWSKKDRPKARDVPKNSKYPDADVPSLSEEEYRELERMCSNDRL